MGPALRISLDLRSLEPGFKAHYGRGTWRYTSELFLHLSRLLAEDEELGKRFLLVPASSRELAGAPWERWILKCLPAGRQTVDTALFAPRRMRKLDASIMHFPFQGDASSLCPLPYIVTVLDLIPLRFAHLYSGEKSSWRFKFARFLEQRSISKACGLLAISECTKRDLIELLGVASEKIAVTPLAVSPKFSPYRTPACELSGAKEGLRISLNLPAKRPVILYVGGIDPRKNVSFLISAFAELLKQGSRASAPLLVLAGAYEQDDQFQTLLTLIKSLGLENDVQLLGFVPDEAIASLYQSAEFTAFPSLYEGFGFPVLESMACGVPVIAGRNSSIVEVAGSENAESGAILLKDNDKAAWVKAMEELLSSDELRLGLAERGIRRASRFSWAQTAQKTLEAYARFARVSL